MIYTTKEILYPYYGMKSYRIEIDTSNSRQHFQRHIWTYANGSVEVQDWIPTNRYDEQRLLKTKMFPVKK